MNICIFSQKNIPAVSELLAMNYSLNKAFQNAADLSAYLEQGEQIDILLCDLTLAGEQPEIILSKINYIIALAEDQSPETLLEALSLGAREVLAAPRLSATELEAALKKAIGYINAYNQRSGVKSANIITFISSKGGIGKSVISTNLAVILQEIFKKKVLLIDTVQRFGSAEIILNFCSRKSLLAVPAEADNLEIYWQEIEKNILRHSGGLDLLLAGDDNHEPLASAKIRSVLKAVRDKYDYLIIDTDNYFVEPVLSLLELSDQIIYLSKMDIASLKNLRLGLDSLKSFYFSLDKVKLVINCFEKTSELSIAELEKFLNWKIFTVLPEDRNTIISSINKGAPFAAEKKDSELFLALRHFAELLQGIAADDQTDNKKTRTWFNSLLKLLA
ncbi:MAG: AAA family ATPase [Candidatus Margulisbacteria bacterium]|jgi:pilus assembly protein CpaE|nr:AAA family ATPase [Candidatus Margulisiibacteriota bacterium]